jgi:hypothetical protein
MSTSYGDDDHEINHVLFADSRSRRGDPFGDFVCASGRNDGNDLSSAGVERRQSGVRLSNRGTLESTGLWRGPTLLFIFVFQTRASAYLAALLAAQARGAVVEIWGTGACTDQSTSETLDYFGVD